MTSQFLFLAPVGRHLAAFAEADVVVDAVVVLDHVQPGGGFDVADRGRAASGQEDAALRTPDLEHGGVGGVGDVAGERRMASVEAVPSRIAVAYLIIESYCGAMRFHRKRA